MLRLIKNVYSGFTNILNYPLNKRYLLGALNIINFHQVADTFDHTYHHRGTFTKFAKFKDFVIKLNSRYGIIPLQEGIKYLQNQKIQNDVLFALTFDDGDISLQEKVIPFLTTEKIPATFFINTAYVNNQSTNWVRAFNYLFSIKHDIFNEKKNVEMSFLEVRNTNNPPIYNKYRIFLENTFRNLECKPEFTLNLEYLKRMDSTLFHFGLHGHEHQRYSMMSYEAQKKDIEKNIEMLNEFTNYVPYWAIPFGTNKDWNRNTIRIALEKELVLLFHTNSVNYIWNSLGVDRIACDGKSFYEIITNLRK